jgi:hypothetical protein
MFNADEPQRRANKTTCNLRISEAQWLSLRLLQSRYFVIASATGAVVSGVLEREYLVFVLPLGKSRGRFVAGRPTSGHVAIRLAQQNA